MDRTLTERYAAPPAWRRPLTVAGVALVTLVALAWVVWAVYGQSNPEVESELVGWRAVDAHSVTARVDVQLADGTTHPRCTVRALADDHTIVGELVFTPTQGDNEVTVRTERPASAVDLAGCVAEGQSRPR